LGKVLGVVELLVGSAEILYEAIQYLWFTSCWPA